jgi:hypothetical protein
MLADAGFLPLRRTSVAGSYSTFFFSVRFWLAGRNSPGWQRRAARAFERSRLARLASAPCFWAVDALGHGPVVTVIARLDRSK